MAARARLDVELVRRGLCRSREHAGELISAGRVLLAGVVAAKAATQVSPGVSIVVRAAPTGEPDYASRGAHKLLGALAVFEPLGLNVAGRRCLDAGASTGGFTDVLLRRGAREVLAVDVGYGQLAWQLRADARVVVLDRTNVRDLQAADIDGPVELLVSDLSFISLRLVLPAMDRCVLPAGDMVLLVKPQFEVGRDRLGPGGVVREQHLRAQAVLDVAEAAGSLGWGVCGLEASPLPGPAGNVELLLWLRRDAPAVDLHDVALVVDRSPVAHLAVRASGRMET